MRRYVPMRSGFLGIPMDVRGRSAEAVGIAPSIDRRVTAPYPYEHPTATLQEARPVQV